MKADRKEKFFIKDRLQQYLRHAGISVNKLETASGLTNRYLNNVHFNVPIDKARRICASLPGLNLGWLLTGEGEMLNPSSGIPVYEEPIVLSETFPKNLPKPIIDNILKDYQIEIHFEGTFKADVCAMSENEAVLSVKQMAFKMPLAKLAKQIGLHDTDIKILLKS